MLGMSRMHKIYADITLSLHKLMVSDIYYKINNMLVSLLFYIFAFLKNLFILFIYFWLRWVFVAVHGPSLVVASGGHSSLRCTGLSLRWLVLLRSMGYRRVGFSSCGTRLSSCGLRALECRLSSCGARA